jgi:hypothetical protein
MKQCNVFILGISEYEEHKLIALSLMNSLKQIKTTHEEYKPYILLCDNSLEAIQKVIAEYTEKLGCDVLISTGYRMTSLLPVVYEALGPIPTIFSGIQDPLRLGILKSLEKPGGMFSGVCMAQPNPQHHAEQLRVLHPYVKKICLPYDPTSLGGVVKKQTTLLVQALQTVGFYVDLCEVYTVQDALTVVATHLDYCHAVLLVEGCSIAAQAEPAIAYMCSMGAKILLSSNGRAGISRGAPFAYGCTNNILLPGVVEMVRRFWRDRKLIGMQPVMMLPDRRRLFVNRFRLPWLPWQIMQKIKNHTECNVLFEWTQCPVNQERNDYE